MFSKLPVPLWCKLLSSFTASIILLPQQLHALRDRQNAELHIFVICLSSVDIDCRFGYECNELKHLVMDSEDWMIGCDVIPP